MGRRNGSANVDTSRVRKISFQNDYAFGIISPVSPTTLPVPVPLAPCANDEVKIPILLVRPWQVESRCSRPDNIPHDPEIDLAVDPLTELPPSSPSLYSTSSERFRRWSFSNFQSAFKETDPAGTEFSSQFTSDEEDFLKSRRNNINGSYVNLLIGKPGVDENYAEMITDFITSIPEKMRKISTEKKPIVSETNIYCPDMDLKEQLKNFFVY